MAETFLAKISDFDETAFGDFRDEFGRQRGGLELSLPSGHEVPGRRLFQVPWRLAKPIIESHIAHHKSLIAILSEKARAEAGA